MRTDVPVNGLIDGLFPGRRITHDTETFILRPPPQDTIPSKTLILNMQSHALNMFVPLTENCSALVYRLWGLTTCLWWLPRDGRRCHT